MSRYLLAVDPGLRVAGVALFNLDSKLLFKAWACKSSVASPVVGAVAWRAMAHAIATDVKFDNNSLMRFIIEEPQVYRGKKAKGDPEDLIQLTGVAGAVVGFFSHTSQIASVKPARWKGTVDGDVMLERILGRLSAEEKSRIVKSPRAKTVNHNAVDACGLGLWALGRLGSGPLPFKEGV